MPIKNFIYQFSDKIIRILYIFLMTYIAAKALGESGFGEFSLLATTIAIAVGVGTFGYEHTLVKKVSEKANKIEQVQWLVNGVILRLGIAILIGIVGFFIINNIFFYFVFLLVCVLSVLNTYEYYLMSHLRGDVIFFGRSLSYIIAITFLIYIYYTNRNSWVYFVFIIEPAIYGIWCFLHIRMLDKLKTSFVKESIDFKKLKELFMNGFPFMLSSLAIILYMRMDVYFIDYFMGKEAVGQYSLAVRFAEAVNFLPIVIANSVFPWLVNHRSSANYRKFFDGLFLASLIVFIPTSFAGMFAIKVLFGNEYNASIYIFVILLFQIIPVFIGVGRAKVLVIENLQRYIPFFVFSGVVLNALLNITLIPLYGIKGAAIATIISQFSTTFIIPLFIQKLRKISVIMLRSVFTCGFFLIFSIFQKSDANEN
ncbi:oligosaccharide flippase family protein [Escherichia coli]|nr:oligosaccharide flippase family protein [Escherichia coli]